MNENPMVPDLALPEAPAEHSLSGVAGMGHAVVPGEIDVSHGTILYLEDVTVSFDGFRALNALTLIDRRRRTALHHRSERRRQDDHDGRHHRQDRAGFRQGVSRPDPSTSRA